MKKMIEMSKSWIVGGKLKKNYYCGVVSMLTFMIFLNSMVFTEKIKRYRVEEDGSKS